MDLLLSILIGFPVLLYSAILHEIAHGLVADRLGDPTARLSGRLTLNPLPHIDVYMSLLLPLMLFLSGSHILFGGAKPVPIDPFNLKEGKKDVALVALAGPLTNLSLAVVGALLSHSISALGMQNNMVIIFMLFFLQTVVYINIILAIFNLLPIPPLDGSKVFALLLPDREATAYLSLGSIGVFIILLLLIFPIGGFSLSTFMSNIYTIISRFLGF